jgi:hypothetical protein
LQPSAASAKSGFGRLEMVKLRPWRIEVGAAVGLLLGVFIWWSAYNPAEGIFQNLRLVIVPAALGIFIVSFRNRRKKVGPYDPEVIERNRRGTL